MASVVGRCMSIPRRPGLESQKLADRAAVGIVTVRQLEAGGYQPRRATLAVIKQALEAAGVEFFDENGGGPGVRLHQGN